MIDVERWAPSLSPVVAAVDIVIAPAVFFTEFAGGGDVDLALERFAGQFDVAVSVATLGSEGSLARCGGATIRTPAIRVPVIDTTGAGDAFRGGFASGWLQMGSGAELEAVLSFANRVAGLNCRATGAQTALPRPADLEDSV